MRLEALAGRGIAAPGGAASTDYSQLEEGGDKALVPAATATTTTPDLHAMGKMFLGPAARLAFDAAVILHFISVLVSYALAGSLAYAQLIGILDQFTLVIPVYTGVYFLVIIFGGAAVQSVISTFTFAKVTLLLFMMGVVGLVASNVNLTPVDDFGASLEPFLLGTVALGGVVNIMPVIFSRVPFNATGIKRFRGAVAGAVILCWVLNIAWAYAVLSIVPQTDELDAEDAIEHPELQGITVSLAQSRERGEISTVPLTQVINHGFPQYSWVSTTVTVFIVLSVSVSFITMGTGLKHVLDGIGTCPPPPCHPVHPHTLSRVVHSGPMGSRGSSSGGGDSRYAPCRPCSRVWHPPRVHPHCQPVSCGCPRHPSRPGPLARPGRPRGDRGGRDQAPQHSSSGVLGPRGHSRPGPAPTGGRGVPRGGRRYPGMGGDLQWPGMLWGRGGLDRTLSTDPHGLPLPVQPNRAAVGPVPLLVWLGACVSPSPPPKPPHQPHTPPLLPPCPSQNRAAEPGGVLGRPGGVYLPGPEP